MERFVDRRTFLRLTAGTSLFPTLSQSGWALDYPTRPVRIMVGYAAGGTADVTARVMAQSMTNRLGQPFVVENRPGAGSNLATSEVAHAQSDGYTMLLATGANAINATLYDNL